MFVAQSRTLSLKTPLLLAACLLIPTACDGGGGEEGPAAVEFECISNAECDGDTPWCSPDSTCEALPLGYQLGIGDGSKNSVGIVEVYAPERPLYVTDLAFNPEHDFPELWILRREHASSEPCEQNNATAAGCAALEGTVAVVWDVGTEDVIVETFTDPNAWHFMRQPTAMAFGADHTFATVSEARTANYLDDNLDYNGPSLWSSDLEIFAIQPPGLNGSHLDMLHHAPYAMGIAHEVDNVYWLFNGKNGSLDRSDFVEDHGPGHAYHGDAIVHRYVSGQVQRAEGIPSHMEVDKSARKLYVADTGNKRVAVLDMESGTSVGRASPNYDQLEVFELMGDADFQNFVAPGQLDAPSGLALHGEVLFVTDNTTSKIHAYDLEGTWLRSLDTGLTAGSLAGLTIGPDDKIYFVDMLRGRVFRIDP